MASNLKDKWIQATLTSMGNTERLTLGKNGIQINLHFKEIFK